MKIDLTAASNPVDLKPRLPFPTMDNEPQAEVRSAAAKCPECGFTMLIKDGCKHCYPNGGNK